MELDYTINAWDILSSVLTILVLVIIFIAGWWNNRKPPRPPAVPNDYAVKNVQPIPRSHYGPTI